MAENTQRLEDRSDDELAVLAQRRRTDPAGARALEILVERYRRQRFTLAYRYGGGVATDDLAQEAALALVRAVDTFRPEKGPVGPWIWRWMWGSSLRAAMKAWSCRGPMELGDSETWVGEPPDDRFETSMEEAVLAAQVRDQERTALQRALRCLPAAAYDAVVIPQLASASQRRVAVAMLRHPSVRPLGAITRQPSAGDRVGSPAVDPANDNGHADRPPDPRGTWLTRAACRGVPPQTFWGKDRARREAAFTACGRCPVGQDCLLDALSLPEGGGIRAGKTEKERRALRRRSSCSDG